MRFFFYGTLMAGSGNPVAEAAHARLRALGPATVRGLLYAIPDPQGWYPALLPGEEQVHGGLHGADGDFGADSLARLDAYENYSPLRPEASPYIRDTIMAIGPGGARGPAQAYLFNRPLSAAACPIPGGDFRAWLADRGFEAFCETPK